MLQAQLQLPPALVDEGSFILLAGEQFRIADDHLGPGEDGGPEEVMVDQAGILLEDGDAMARDEPLEVERMRDVLRFIALNIHPPGSGHPAGLYVAIYHP